MSQVRTLDRPARGFGSPVGHHVRYEPPTFVCGPGLLPLRAGFAALRAVAAAVWRPVAALMGRWRAWAGSALRSGLIWA